MKNKVKVKVINHYIHVYIPYKSGLVEYRVLWGNVSPHKANGERVYSFDMCNIAHGYSPKRVSAAHKEFLSGKFLARRIERHLAATYYWVLLEQFKIGRIVKDINKLF